METQWQGAGSLHIDNQSQGKLLETLKQQLADQQPHYQKQQHQKGKGKGHNQKSTHQKPAQHEKKGGAQPLPIESFELGGVNIFVHTNQQTKQEYIIILKRSIKNFIYHADDFYRDSGSKRNNFLNEECKPQDKELNKFYKNRYYLFSKFDRGIKIDDESWYSITPEPVSKHVANRVASVFGEGQTNSMDGFCGVGGNLIQMARKTGFCVGNEFDPLKCEYAFHNSKIYTVDKNVQMINKDFLNLSIGDIHFPEGRSNKIDVVYMSPPWGGIGYNMLPEYSVKYLHPEFNKVIKKALEFSRNIIMFLPRNTSIEELVEYLVPYAAELSEDPENRKNELILEVEQIVYGTSCKGVHIYTGQMAGVDHREVVEYFYQKYCQPSQGDENYLKLLLGNIFQLCGYKDFIQYFNRDPSQNTKISLQKVIKKIQAQFSEEEWTFLKKYHRKNPSSRTNSRKSSTLSQMSVEEEKKSETSSVTSKKSNYSSQKQYRRKEPALIFPHPEDIVMTFQQEEEDDQDQIEKLTPQKKVVHFNEKITGHIELRDLKEKDFIDLIESKNQDKRFYGWLHFGPIFGDDSDEKHYNLDPQQDIEYFRQLYDNNFFTSFESEIPKEPTTNKINNIPETDTRNRNYSIES